MGLLHSEMSEEQEKQQNEPVKQVISRNPDGTWPKGVSGNPNHIPRGRSMKTYWRNKFMKMTDEEIEEWCKKNKVAAELIWQMGEGRPKQSVDGGEDENGNPMPFTIVNTSNVHSGEVPAPIVPTPPDTSV